MLSTTLVILQIVAFLTYPPILFSIISGRNIISEMSKGNCKNVKNKVNDPKKQKDIDKKCDELMNIRTEIYLVMISFILSIILYAIAIYFEAINNKKLFKIFIFIGGIFSILSLFILFYIIYSIGNLVKEMEKIQKAPIDDINKYLWYMSILPMVFTVITIILVIINYFKK